MTEGEILKEYIDTQRVSKVSVAQALGISRRTLYQYFESNVLTDEIKEKFTAFFKTQIFDKAAIKHLHIARRKQLKEVGETKSGIQVFETAPTYASIKNVYHDEHIVPDYVLKIPQFRDCNYGTRASGDSMYPEIRNGDLVFCKELPVDARIIFGDMYVVHTRDGIETIKYIQQYVDGDKDEAWVLLVPHNKAAGMGTPIPRSEVIRLFKVRAIFKGF